MTTIGYLLLTAALLCSLLYIPISATIRPLSGPDAMEFAGLIFLSLARWIVLLGAVTIAAARGGFPWIHPSRGVQWLAALLFLGASGGLEFWSLDAATSGWYGREARPWVGAFAVVVPLIILLLTAAALSNGPRFSFRPSTLRMFAVGTILLMTLGVVVIGAKSHAGARERRAWAAEAEQERARARDEKLAAFRALGPASPLREWLPWTSESDDEIRDAAVVSIRARPRLIDEVAEILHSDDPLPGLRWLWLWTPDPPESLAGPVCDAAKALPDLARRRYDDEDPSNDSGVATACEALVVIADEFPGKEPEFRRSFEAIRAFLQSRALPEEQMSYDPTYRARAMLQYWFDRHPDTPTDSEAKVNEGASGTAKEHDHQEHQNQHSRLEDRPGPRAFAQDPADHRRRTLAGHTQRHQHGPELEEHPDRQRQARARRKTPLRAAPECSQLP